MSVTEAREELATSHETKIQELWARAGRRVEQLRDIGVDADRYVWAKDTDNDKYRVHRRANSVVVQLAIELQPYRKNDDIDDDEWKDEIGTVEITDDRITPLLEEPTRSVSMHNIGRWSMDHHTIEWVENDRLNRAEKKQRQIQLVLPPRLIEQAYQHEVELLHDLGFATEAKQEREKRDHTTTEYK